MFVGFRKNRDPTSGAMDALASDLMVIVINGAVEKTRTSTPFKEQRPQRCASTNSATTARIRICNRQVFHECEAEISSFFISLAPEPQARIPFKELRHMQKIERLNLLSAAYRIQQSIQYTI